MVIHNIGVGTHRHDSSFYFDFMKDILLWNFHHSNCPTLFRIFAIKCLVHCAHGSFPKLFGKTIDFVRIFRFELDATDLFLEFRIRDQRIFWYLFLSLQSIKNLDHCSWVLFDLVFRQVIFLEELHHIIA